MCKNSKVRAHLTSASKNMLWTQLKPLGGEKCYKIVIWLDHNIHKTIKTEKNPKCNYHIPRSKKIFGVSAETTTRWEKISQNKKKNDDHIQAGLLKKNENSSSTGNCILCTMLESFSG